MRILSTLAISLLAIASAVHSTSAATNTSSNATDTPNVYVNTVKRIVVPFGQKTYVVGLRNQENDPYLQCSGVLISATHVLTTASCISKGPRWAIVGMHTYNSTNEGEHIKFSAALPHPSYSNFTNDFMVLELEKPSSYAPVQLAAADDSDIKVGEWASVLGWKFIKQSAERGPELESARVKIMSNTECGPMVGGVDTSMVCAGGLANEDPCHAHFGGPLIVTPTSGSRAGQDVVVGMMNWGIDCGRVNTPSIHARVSSGRDWIDSVTKSTCAA